MELTRFEYEALLNMPGFAEQVEAAKKRRQDREDEMFGTYAERLRMRDERRAAYQKSQESE